MHEAWVTGGVAHVEYGAFVARGNLYGRVRGRGRCAADDNRDALACVLHGLRDSAHFFEGWRDEAREAQDVGLVLDDRLHDDIFGNHHAEVHHLVAVTGHNHGDDVLADIVHVAFDGGNHDFPAARSVGVLARLDVGLQNFYRLLHGACGLHHLRQEHLAFSEKPSHGLHSFHQRSFDDTDRLAVFLKGLHQILFQCLRPSLYNGIAQPFLQWYGSLIHLAVRCLSLC